MAAPTADGTGDTAGINPEHIYKRWPPASTSAEKTFRCGDVTAKTECL